MESVWFASLAAAIGVALAGYVLVRGESLLRTYVEKNRPMTREQALRQRLTELERELAEALARVKLLEERVEWLLDALRKPPYSKPLPDEAADAAADEERNRKQVVLVAIGPDPDLTVDLVAFRKVEQQTGLHFVRLTGVSQRKLESYLNRHRMKRKPVRLVHFAVHGTSHGLEFSDGVVSGQWLSEKLNGVEVVVLAACESDAVGDLLRNVPYVVTLLEPVDHQDAMLFTEAFWTCIGQGWTPEDAFYEALERCPSDVAEFAQLHSWD